MLDHQLRSLKDQVLSIVAHRFRHIHPNIITLFAFGIGLAAGLCITQQFYVWGLVLWLLNRLFDGLDGLVARIHNRQSDLGGYLDILLDFAIYALIPIALVYSAPSLTRYLMLAFLLSSFYLNAASWLYLSAVLEKRASGAQTRGELTSVTMPTGLIGGTETIIFYCLFILFPLYIEVLFSLMAMLVLVTVGQRLVWAIRHLD